VLAQNSTTNRQGCARLKARRLESTTETGEPEGKLTLGVHLDMLPPFISPPGGHTRSIQCIIAATVALGQLGWAATGLLVFSAVVNYTKSEIQLTGQGFSPTGLAPAVSFATTKLTLVSFSNTSVTASVPTGFAAGTYALVIVNSANQSVSF
jgi:hypothetical protein